MVQLSKETKEFLVLPTDPLTEERRYRELETACQEILAGLPPKDRETLSAFYALLRRGKDREVLTAYNSGIQVGIQRAKAGKQNETETKLF